MSFGFKTGTANGLSAPDWLNEDTPTGIDTTFGEDIEISLKAGFYGMANNFIQIGNFLGSDAEEYDLYEEMGDLGDAYLSNKTGYDIAGEVITSFIPGGVGMKAIKLAKLGKLGTTASKLMGFSQKLVATNKELELAYKGIATADEIRSLKRKAFVYATAEQAIEGAIISTFVDSSLHLGEILNDEGLDTIDKAMKFGSNILFWSLAPAPVFAPFTYLAKTKGSRDVLKNLNKAKQEHAFKRYAQADLNTANVTAGSSIAHNLDQIEIIEARPIKTGTPAEEAYRTQQLQLAKEAVAEDIKFAVVGKGKLLKKDEPLVNILTNIAYSKLGTPDSNEVKQLFERGKQFELGGVPNYAPKVKTLIAENKDKINFSDTFNNSTRRFFKEGDKLFVNNKSSYLKDYDKAILHYFGDNFNKNKALVASEIKSLINSGDIATGLDSFSAIKQAHKLFTADEIVRKSKEIINKPHVGFKEAHPNLTGLFAKKGSSYIYGEERIKYADIKSGKVIELPIPHVGDLGVSVSRGKIVVEHSTVDLPNKTIKRSTDLGKVEHPIVYQANRIIINNSSQELKNIDLLVDATPEEAIKLEKMVREFEPTKGAPADEIIIGKDKYKINDILERIRKSKATEANRLLKTGMSADTVENTLGVSTNFILTRGNKFGVDATDYISEVKSLQEPKHLKITTDVDLPSTEAIGFEATLASQRESQLSFLKEVADFITGEKLDDKLVGLDNELSVTPLGINRELQDAITIGGFKSLNLATATIGHYKNVMATANFEGAILPELNRLSSIVLNSNEASASFLAFRNWYDRQSAKFVKMPGLDTVWLEEGKLKSVEEQLSLGLTSDEIIKGFKNGTDYYKISDGNTALLIDRIQEFNREHIIGKQLVIERAYGNNPINSIDRLYLPPRDYPHIRYVRVTDNIADEHSVQMYRIIGSNEEDLAHKISKAELMGQEKGQTWTILTPEQVQKVSQYQKEFDWAGKDLNLGKAISTEKRGGAIEDLYPELDASKLVNETISWFKRKNDLVYSAAIEMHYADFVTELDSLIRAEQNALELTTVGGRIKRKIERRIGTYEQLKAQMLGYDKGGYSPWKQMNNVVEEYGAKFGTIVNKARLQLLGLSKEKKLQYKDIVKQSNLLIKLQEKLSKLIKLYLLKMSKI